MGVVGLVRSSHRRSLRNLCDGLALLIHNAGIQGVIDKDRSVAIDCRRYRTIANRKTISIEGGSRTGHTYGSPVDARLSLRHSGQDTHDLLKRLGGRDENGTQSINANNKQMYLVFWFNQKTK